MGNGSFEIFKGESKSLRLHPAQISEIYARYLRFKCFPRSEKWRSVTDSKEKCIFCAQGWHEIDIDGPMEIGKYGRNGDRHPSRSHIVHFPIVRFLHGPF